MPPDRNADAPQVSILVVAFRAAGFIDECLEGITESAAGIVHEILLIDNGDDGTGAHVRTAWPQVRIVPGEGNIGFGAGNNRLAAQARAPLLLLVNPDAVPRDDAVARLVRFAQAHPEAGAWGGRSLSPSGHLDAGNFLILPRPLDFVKLALGRRRALSSGGLPAGATAPGRAEVLNGGFMMVRADVWRELGGFDEGFFLYSEEIDLFLRMRERGYPVLVTPDAAVIHDLGGGDALSSTRLLYRTTGQMHYAHKHFGSLGAFVTGAALWLLAAQNMVLGALAAPFAGRRGKRLRIVSKAWRPLALAPGKWWHGYNRR